MGKEKRAESVRFSEWSSEEEKSAPHTNEASGRNYSQRAWVARNRAAFPDPLQSALHRHLRPHEGALRATYLAPPGKEGAKDEHACERQRQRVDEGRPKSRRRVPWTNPPANGETKFQPFLQAGLPPATRTPYCVQNPCNRKRVSGCASPARHKSGIPKNMPAFTAMEFAFAEGGFYSLRPLQNSPQWPELASRSAVSSTNRLFFAITRAEFSEKPFASVGHRPLHWT